jgi:4-carboxymuconolactone decarboxylase
MFAPPKARDLPVGQVAPAFAGYTDDIIFGDLWKREALSPRDRSLVTLAALTALYRQNELPFHLRYALQNGVTREEIAEVITHLAFYSGWPTAASAMGLAQKAFDEADAAEKS